MCSFKGLAVVLRLGASQLSPCCGTGSPPAGAVHLDHPVLSDPVIRFPGRFGFCALVSQLKEAEGGVWLQPVALM